VALRYGPRGVEGDACRQLDRFLPSRFRPHDLRDRQHARWRSPGPWRQPPRSGWPSWRQRTAASATAWIAYRAAARSGAGSGGKGLTGLGRAISAFIGFPAQEGQMSLRRREFIAGLGGAAAMWPPSITGAGSAIGTPHSIRNAMRSSRACSRVISGSCLCSIFAASSFGHARKNGGKRVYHPARARQRREARRFSAGTQADSRSWALAQGLVLDAQGLVAGAMRWQAEGLSFCASRARPAAPPRAAKTGAAVARHHADRRKAEGSRDARQPASGFGNVRNMASSTGPT
jgi:hypothetical protein